MTKENNENTNMSVTDILQAHDILLSILLGKTLGMYKDPQKIIDNITEIVDDQEINDNAKHHIKLLLAPLKESF